MNRQRVIFGRTTFLVVGLFIATAAFAQTDGQKTFASSSEAVDALISAIRQHNVDDLQAMLGAGSGDILSSGDAVADRASGDNFLKAYDTKHSLVASGSSQMTLNVGADGWPLPIPLVHSGDQWYWDGAAGKEEILYRRIGHNEIDAISVCHGVVAAQKDYAAAGHDGQPAGAFAPRVLSDPGKQNGLYWEVKDGEAASPAGPMLAAAVSEGYTNVQHTPYHGYYYRMLTNPKGFGFLAYPAEYRNSGVMTFIVSQSGVVYQKDLGENTASLAQQMTTYQVDNTWTPAR